jgi:hypothetical protein
MKPLRYPGSVAAVTGVHISCQSRNGQRTATQVLLCLVTLLISCLLGGTASGQVSGQNVNMVSPLEIHCTCWRAPTTTAQSI